MQLKQAAEKGSPLEEAQVHITKLSTKVKQLEVTLQAKEQDYACLDAKYKKCVEKAKEVIKAMDPRAAGGLKFDIFSKTFIIILILLFRSSSSRQIEIRFK